MVDTLFEAEGTLGSNAHAHMEENGAFVLELRMITGFDHTETRVVLWTAPNTDSGKGGYARQGIRSVVILVINIHNILPTPMKK